MTDQASPYRPRKASDPARAFAEATSFHRRGRLGEAEALYKAFLEAEPDHFGALHRLGLVRAQQGKLEEAARLIGKAIGRNPNSAEAHNNLGNVLSALGRGEAALVHFERAVALRPGVAGMRFNCGNALLALKRHREAAAQFEQALALKPGQADVNFKLGIALAALARRREAAAQFEQVLALEPGHAEAHNNLGNALAALDRPAEALAHYERALALKPDSAGAYANIGNLLMELGHLDEARQALEKAVALAPRRAMVYRHLARAKRFAAGDPALAAMEELAKDMAALGQEERIELHFALAKASADLEQHERSFRHLAQGNALKRQLVVYDEAHTLALFERIQAAFTPELMRDKAGLGDPSPLPLFVIGMPRSGTTLAEQILASHPKAFGAGELLLFRDAVPRGRWPGGADTPYPEAAAAMTGEELSKLAARYLADTSALAPAAERIVDKQPMNFLFAGLIHLALPKARILHMRRDPVDTCFSCFSQLFAGEQSYAYDLGELGRYYRGYARLMAHWQAVLPPGVMLEVQYEELVGDFEGQARRIVAHAGLDWDDACLAFHETERRVRTASAVQVRQPIYRSAVGRARPYGELLRPLLEALGAPEPPR
ncbi:MAG: sulfotransferase [Alphaproteobacteria bacterium]